MLVVERHYLRTYGGGFTENFYGLKRERVLQIKGGEAPRARLGAPGLLRETLQLQERDIWNNLVVMVGLPYLKRKLDESYDVHTPQAAIIGPSYNRDNLPHNATIRQRVLYYYKWFLRNIYPSVNAAYYFSLLAFSLAYLFDNSKYSSPFLWLIGTRIRRLSEADHRAIALAAQPAATSQSPAAAARPGQASSIFNPLTFASLIYPRLLSSLKILLPTSIFALKFLEWWHASDFARQLSKKATEGLDLPPPIISGLPPKGVSRSRRDLTQAGSHSATSAPANTVSLSFSPIAENHQPAAPATASHKYNPPICATTLLPIYTVPAPKPNTSSLCPICLHPIQTPTSAQTGFVFCYTCIFKWMNGNHEKQIAFMEGRRGTEEGWDEEDDEEEEGREGEGKDEEEVKSRVGKWESGEGRCAVTGRMVLAGTDGLRRVMV